MEFIDVYKKQSLNSNQIGQVLDSLPSIILNIDLQNLELTNIAVQALGRAIPLQKEFAGDDHRELITERNLKALSIEDTEVREIAWCVNADEDNEENNSMDSSQEALAREDLRLMKVCHKYQHQQWKKKEYKQTKYFRKVLAKSPSRLPERVYMQEACLHQQVNVSEEILIELENTIPRHIKDFIRQKYGQEADLMMYNYKTDQRYTLTITNLYKEKKPMIDKL